jgi:hypothetical protein
MFSKNVPSQAGREEPVHGQWASTKPPCFARKAS